MTQVPARSWPLPDCREVGDLTMQERLLLHVYRQWLRGVTTRDARHWQFAWCEMSTAMQPAVAREALGALERLLRVIAGHATRIVSFHPPCCGLLAEDEHLILGLIASAQHGRPRQLEATAARLVSPVGISGVAEAAETLAGALAAGGLHLPEPDGAGANVVRLDDHRPSGRTVH